MDHARFDTLTRSLPDVRSRRGVAQLLAGLTGAGLLTALGVPEVAAATLIGGSRCSKDSRCKTGTCLSTNKCSCSRNFPRCKRPSNPCKQAVCDVDRQRCVKTTKQDRATCGTGNICQNGLCARTCTPGSDECGSGCHCAAPASGGSSVCVKKTGTGAFCQTSPCPSGAICINNVGIFDCFEPCGAS